MDTHCSSKLNYLKRVTILAAAGFLSLCAVRTSAYLTDRTHSDSSARTASMGFSIHGHGAEADLSGERDHLLPFTRGEHFNITFLSSYNGSTDCFALPKLTVLIRNGSGREQIRVEQDEIETVSENGEAVLVSGPRRCMPGDLLEYTYTLTIEQAETEAPLILDYEFSLAAAQYFLNEDLADGSRTNEEVFEEIVQRFSSNDSTGEFGINGFTAYSGPEEVWDTGTDRPLSESGTHIVEFTPLTETGNGADHDTVWYFEADAGDPIAYRTRREDAALVLRLSALHPEAVVRYELSNEAGISASPKYIVRLDGEEVHYSEQEYIPWNDD